MVSLYIHSTLVTDLEIARRQRDIIRNSDPCPPTQVTRQATVDSPHLRIHLFHVFSLHRALCPELQ